ncbi:ARM repeat-containing protein [Gonapodya prolifera JEL478]|uniref:ARM repeat-containing protein n=1 Tax=Gonapodya prolifera (strain JEL478) TaxID=1344416 RepID=A0A139AB03_GONPJ|nr:ARM repeat-containing protein [Gonapodya prolifera JEL478]|eukprot:KXS13573.1 ARM repeat-containing protein [Gonapodya prolifera JEL478]
MKDRNAKRRAIEKIRKETVDRLSQQPAKTSSSLPALPPSKDTLSSSVPSISPGLNLAVLDIVFAEVLPGLIRCFADPVERTRDAAVTLAASFVALVSNLPRHLPLLFPGITLRIGAPPSTLADGGNQSVPSEPLEPSEELRLSLNRLVATIVAKLHQKEEDEKKEDDGLGDYHESGVGPYVDEVIQVIESGMADSYPEIKKESCKLLAYLCTLLSAARRLRPHVEDLVKQIIPLLGYRHATVRVLGVQALRPLLIHDAAPLTSSDIGLSDHLRRLTLDSSAQVRLACYQTCGSWLLELPDRYSVGYRFLPIVLCGCMDEQGGMAAVCKDFLEKAGALYEVEWKDRVKDQVDYEKENQGRPRIGLRHLARDNTQKCLSFLLPGLRSWQPEARLRDAGGMRVLLGLLEENVTGYVDEVVKGFVLAVNEDEEPKVVEEILLATTILGRYVHPSTFVPLFLAYLEPTSLSSPGTRRGALRLLTAAIAETPAGRLKEHHAVIASMMAGGECAGSESAPTMRRVAEVVEACCKVVEDERRGKKHEGSEDVVKEEVTDSLMDFDVARVYYGALAKIAAVVAGMDERVMGVPEAREQSARSLDRLAAALSFPETAGVHRRFLFPLLQELSSSVLRWTRHSAEPTVLRYAALNAGDEVGRDDCAKLILEVVEIGSKEEKDMEVRESVLSTLHALLTSPSNPLNSQGILSLHTNNILSKILLPNTIWRPGKKARELRRKTMQVVLAWFTAPGLDRTVHGSEIRTSDSTTNNAIREVVGVLDARVLQDSLQEVVGAFNSNTDDDDVETRRATLRCWNEMWKGVGKKLKFSADQLKLIYPELLKRLDDAHDDLRVLVAGTTWPLFFCLTEQWQAQAREDERLIKMNGDGSTYVETSLDIVHWEEMCKGLTIHVDDSNPSVQEAAATALASMALCSACPPEVVRDHLASVHGKFRNQGTVDGIIKIAQNRIDTA